MEYSKKFGIFYDWPNKGVFMSPWYCPKCKSVHSPCSNRDSVFLLRGEHKDFIKMDCNTEPYSEEQVGLTPHLFSVNNIVRGYNTEQEKNEIIEGYFTCLIEGCGCIGNTRMKKDGNFYSDPEIKEYRIFSMFSLDFIEMI